MILSQKTVDISLIMSYDNIIKTDKEVIKVLNIKNIREAKGLTQVQVAEALNVVQSAVAIWESGKMQPQTSKLPKIAELFGCSIDDLFVK